QVRVNLSQIVLNTIFYSYFYIIFNFEYTSPGCPFTRPGDPGPYTNLISTLSFKKIIETINFNNIIIIWDETAAVNYIIWNN
ncbi:hypothetical protein ASPTUDRAFT_130331, partial [Aspergillus tubingensis CBS 134.48]